MSEYERGYETACNAIRRIIRGDPPTQFADHIKAACEVRREVLALIDVAPSPAERLLGGSE